MFWIVIYDKEETAMKNTNFKTKLIARIMVFVLLLTSVFSFAGCGHMYKYYRRRELYRVGSIPPGDFWLRSKTNTFDVDNVTLELVIGLNKVSLFGKMKESLEDQYSIPKRASDMGFAIYICKREFAREFTHKSMDIENIENHLFIRKITRQEASAKEYRFNIFKSNHKENITIPSVFLDEIEGSFVIKLATYYQYNDSPYFYCSESRIFNIVLEYEKISDNQIVITNFYERWYAQL